MQHKLTEHQGDWPSYFRTRCSETVHRTVHPRWNLLFPLSPQPLLRRAVQTNPNPHQKSQARANLHGPERHNRYRHLREDRRGQ